MGDINKAKKILLERAKFDSNKKKWQQQQEDCLMLPVVDSGLAHKTTD